MKNYYLPLFLVLLAACNQPPAKKTIAKAYYDYCYSNKSGVFLFSQADKQDTRLSLNGTDANLSPNGTQVAYTDYGAPDHERRIGVMDLDTKKVTILDSNCHNCYGPVWSPDGKYIAYNAYINHNWSIKYIDKDNLHPVVLTNPAGSLLGFFSPTWSSDSKKVVVQDMSSVIMIDINGGGTTTLPFEDIDSMTDGSSSARFVLSNKGDKLLYERADGSMSDYHEPPTAVFAYDLATKKTNRISPEGYDCGQPVIKGGTIFFTGSKYGSKTSNTYSTDINGGHFGMAFKNRTQLSCRLAD